jgi:hypothetical protein
MMGSSQRSAVLEDGLRAADGVAGGLLMGRQGIAIGTGSGHCGFPQLPAGRCFVRIFQNKTIV